MKALNWLLLVIILGATAGIYFLLGPVEKTSLFYVNFAITLALEIVLACVIFWNRNNIQKLATTTQIAVYTLMCGVWMLAFNLWLADKISVHWYYAVFLLLTINYAAVIVFLLQGGAHQQQVNAGCACATALKNQDNEHYHSLLHKLHDALDSPIPAPNQDSMPALRLAVEKITLIAKSTRERNPGFMDAANARFAKIEADIDALSQTGDRQERSALLERIAKESRSLSAYISESKNRLV